MGLNKELQGQINAELDQATFKGVERMDNHTCTLVFENSKGAWVMIFSADSDGLYIGYKLRT